MSKAGQKIPVRTFRVAKRFQQVVESTRYKNSPYTAGTLFRTPSLRKAMLRQMRKCISRESKTGTPSVLRRSSVEDVKRFKWTGVSRKLYNTLPGIEHSMCSTRKEKSSNMEKSSAHGCCNSAVSPQPVFEPPTISRINHTTHWALF